MEQMIVSVIQSGLCRGLTEKATGMYKRETDLSVVRHFPEEAVFGRGSDGCIGVAQESSAGKERGARAGWHAAHLPEWRRP